jgi:uncharacterized protein
MPNDRGRMLKRVLLTAAAFTAPGLALTLGCERALRPQLYYSGEWCPDPPDDVRHPYEEARFYTADGLELQGWFFPATPRDGRPAPTLLFMHGTSYNASDMWCIPERAEMFHEFLRDTGYNFFVFDYRGYGRNPGSPTEEGTYLDAAAALGWLYGREDIDPETLFFYGYSLGTGIAVELAAREPCAGLMLRAPYTSIRDIIVHRYPRTRSAFALAPWLPLTNYDSLSKIRRYHGPLLVMHGDADETVPAYMGDRLHVAAPGPKMHVNFPDADHTTVRNDLVVPSVTRFVESVLSGELEAAAREEPRKAARAQ